MPKFVMPPLDRRTYLAMMGPEFGDFCKEVAQMNKRWVREHLDDDNTSWAVVVDGKIIESSSRVELPSVEYVRSMSTPESVAILISRPTTQLKDKTIYFDSGSSKKICDLLKADNAEVRSYREPVEAINCLDTRSGALPKLAGEFGVANLTYLKVLIGEELRPNGVYVARIPGDFHGGRSLDIDSQSETQINKRGFKTLSQREPGKWIRLERLHRYEDPILDIMNTYASCRGTGWPELVLCRDRNKHTRDISQ
jgi:hypothetical protein